LFSSFAILLNFPRFGKMKGMGQIVTYSIRDESLHVEAMTKLFREFIQENIDIWTDDFKKEIYQACREMVTLEDKFLDLVFQMGDIEGLTKEEMKQYIRYIADRRLLQLGLKPNYGVKDNPLNWIDDVLGVEHQNFFEGRATTYMKAGIKGNMDSVEFKNLSIE
jgi:ribonucleoside-diphosphate reductase beta chain